MTTADLFIAVALFFTTLAAAGLASAAWAAHKRHRGWRQIDRELAKHRHPSTLNDRMAGRW